ncbi:MAG: hypothetical protein LC798_01160 [Chloroflexi bacterium]|nr:hypothetical protein [Chloroflexota bacterium]
MVRAKAASETDAPDPDKLIRQKAGIYRTGDDRFEIREGDVGWFLVDPEQTNEFGQELIHGPYPTLNAVREALPGARSAGPAPSQKVDRRAAKDKPRAKTAPRPPAPPPPPPTWIEQLPRREGAAVRKLIAALGREGIGDAEALVRRDRDGLLPAVATRLIERRLDALVDELPEQGREAAREFVQRVALVISSEGSAREPLPGWALVEIGPEPESPKRRIDLRT